MNPTDSRERPERTVAAVVVTYNRCALLEPMLESLTRLTRPLDAVVVVDNASTDATAEVLERFAGRLPLDVVRSPENLGGAGGFRLGLERAYLAGHDWFWLMDDDVVPAPDCLERLLAHDVPAMIAVREDRHGALVEKAALRFDLRSPLAIRPKRASIDSTWSARADMPELVEVENAAFEGFLVSREVVAAVGLPDDAFFIFYDDVDYILRARRAGYRVSAVRDAVLVRQLDFDQQHALDSWKGFYMYRNLFWVHFRHGENLAVRYKPFLITAAVLALAPIRGGRAEARNVWRALRSAYSRRHAGVRPPAGPGDHDTPG